MEKTVIVRLKNVYGNELIYPVNKTALLFAAITGKKTLDAQTIEAIKILGFAIEVEQQQI